MATSRSKGTTSKATRDEPVKIALVSRPPNKIPTGVPDTLITFQTDAFYGYPSNFNFGDYQGQFEQLSDILERNDLFFHQVGAGKNGGFVAVMGYLDNPLFVWENYIGDQGKHEVNVYLAGIKMQLATFLKKLPQDQDELLANARLKAWVIQ